MKLIITLLAILCASTAYGAAGTQNLSTYTGYMKHAGCYGELYKTGGATAITVATTGTFYQWVNSTVGLESGDGYVDCDATTDDCIIESTQCAGTYLITLSASFSGENSAVINCAVAVDDTENTKIMFERTLGLSAAIGAAPATGLLALANGEAVTVECTSDTNADEVIPHILNMRMTRIGN